ncbi:MAG: GFA family protein [Bauldia litoralis]
MSGMSASGRCLCGGVQFTAAGVPGVVSVCHCDICRRWIGGPMMAVHPEGGIEFQADGTLVWYRSSDWAERGFCSTCGSSLFYRLSEQPDYVAIGAGVLDPAEAYSGIENHIFVDEKPGFYEFADDAPRRTGAEVIAEFSGEEQ